MQLISARVDGHSLHGGKTSPARVKQRLCNKLVERCPNVEGHSDDLSEVEGRQWQALPMHPAA
jgi:hypothetical protein